MKENPLEKIVFCKKCVESNQRFMGSIQHLDTKDNIKQRASIDDGICGACKYFESKKKINWAEREKELIEILKSNKFYRPSYKNLSGGIVSIHSGWKI